MPLIGIVTSVMSTSMKEQREATGRSGKGTHGGAKGKMRVNLLRAVSHDLRTPLTGIIGSSTSYLEMGTSCPNRKKGVGRSNRK